MPTKENNKSINSNKIVSIYNIPSLLLNNAEAFRTKPKDPSTIAPVCNGIARGFFKTTVTIQYFGPDDVVGPQTDLVRDGSVLPHLLVKLLLDYEGLVGRLCIFIKKPK
ncbi:unnamed protein product [Prunus brigantina]